MGWRVTFMCCCIKIYSFKSGVPTSSLRHWGLPEGPCWCYRLWKYLIHNLVTCWWFYTMFKAVDLLQQYYYKTVGRPINTYSWFLDYTAQKETHQNDCTCVLCALELQFMFIRQDVVDVVNLNRKIRSINSSRSTTQPLTYLWLK